MSEKSEEINIESPEKLESIDNNIKLKKGNRIKILLTVIGGVVTLVFAPIVVFEYQNFRVSSPHQEISNKAISSKKLSKQTNIGIEVINRKDRMIEKIPFGASLLSPDGISVLQVLKKEESKYTLTKNISAGDTIWFQIHSVANKAPLQNVTNKLVNLDNLEFDKDSSANITAIVSATGVPSVKGTVSLFFKDSVRLQYVGYQWHKKKIGENHGENETSPLPNKQKGWVTIDSYASLGALPLNYRSNLLLKFKAEKFKSKP